MILKALYDYYYRLQAIDDSISPQGFKEQKIHFIIVIDEDGNLLDIEDMRIDKKNVKTFLVVDDARSANIKPYKMYDNGIYLLNHPKDDSEKEKNNALKRNEAFIRECQRLNDVYPDNKEFAAVVKFYENGGPVDVKSHPLWTEITKIVGPYFSFRLKGASTIAACSPDLKNEVTASVSNTSNADYPVCLVTGNKEEPQEILSATPIIGGKSNGKLVAFQVNSGYDSYGHEKGLNAPISKSAAAAFSTALIRLLDRNSPNKLLIGNRSFVFWASSTPDKEKTVADGLSCLFGFESKDVDDPNQGIEKVKSDFRSLYNGLKTSNSTDIFYFLGLAPNSARIAVVYWQEYPLSDFIANILKHFDDMEIADDRKDKKPYSGLMAILSTVTQSGKSSDVQPNLPEAIMKSILQNIPYPASLFTATLRRIRAEQSGGMRITRIAIIKAYLNRLNDNQQKITVMLNTDETNVGYLAGRLFAVFEHVQTKSNGIKTIRERYMNAASATPAMVFPTLFNLHTHHLQKLNEGTQVYYEKVKREIMENLPSTGFPSHLSLNDQGRFFVGYYHQTQKLWEGKNTGLGCNSDNN